MIYSPGQSSNPCCLSPYTSKGWDVKSEESGETENNPPAIWRVNIFLRDRTICALLSRMPTGRHIPQSTGEFSDSGSSSGRFSFCKCVPALGCDVKFISSFCINLFPFLRICHIANHTDIFV